MQHVRPAIVLTLFFVVFTGFAFPLAVWATAQLVFPAQASGSLIRDAQGRMLGSALLGQAFGKPEYFHPRPSAAGAGYDAASSGGTNLGPTSAKLIQGFLQLSAAYRSQNELAPDALLPADAVTGSASGLDPHISPANAELQSARVARARGLRIEHVRALVAEHTEGRTWGLFGEPRVNVLLLNLALDGKP